MEFKIDEKCNILAYKVAFYKSIFSALLKGQGNSRQQ